VGQVVDPEFKPQCCKKEKKKREKRRKIWRRKIWKRNKEKRKKEKDRPIGTSAKWKRKKDKIKTLLLKFTFCPCYWRSWFLLCSLSTLGTSLQFLVLRF
jgi:hypothetical protein